MALLAPHYTTRRMSNLLIVTLSHVVAPVKDQKHFYSLPACLLIEFTSLCLFPSLSVSRSLSLLFVFLRLRFNFAAQCATPLAASDACVRRILAVGFLFGFRCLFLPFYGVVIL